MSMSERHQFGESEEMYLKTVYVLAEAQDPVPVTALAEKLKITTVSASEMVRRLQERKLLEHTPYKGVRLTPLGENRARDILRRHRLWERFLTDQLELDWAHAHDAACQLEHLTDEEIMAALDRFLGHPETCPHGNPIPRDSQQVSRKSRIPLSALQVGDEATIVRIQNEETALLAHLAGHGLRPGQRFLLEEIAPYDGPRALRMGEEVQVVGRDVAEHIIVQKSSRGND
jgi:DtxR family Mn-dependent transcriptional regulator